MRKTGLLFPFQISRITVFWKRCEKKEEEERKTLKVKLCHWKKHFLNENKHFHKLQGRQSASCVFRRGQAFVFSLQCHQFFYWTPKSVTFDFLIIFHTYLIITVFELQQKHLL